MFTVRENQIVFVDGLCVLFTIPTDHGTIATPVITGFDFDYGPHHERYVPGVDAEALQEITAVLNTIAYAHEFTPFLINSKINLITSKIRITWSSFIGLTSV